MTTSRYPGPPPEDHRAELRRKTVAEVVRSNGIEDLVSDVAYTQDETARVLTVKVTLVPGAEVQWGRRQFEARQMLLYWVPDGWTVELVVA